MQSAKQVDCLIIGLGLSGAAVALELMRQGKSVAIFDMPGNNRSSNVAAGLFNPISGKLMVKTWKADELFPYLHQFYAEAERVSAQKFFFPKPIYIPFRSIEEQNAWMTQGDDDSIRPYVEHVLTSTSFAGQVVDDLGGLLLRQCGYLNVTAYLKAVRELIGSNFCIEDQVHYDKLIIQNDFVQYEAVRATTLFLCEGLHALRNPLTNWLPLKPLKGETIDVRFSQEPGAIFNRGVYAVPLSPNVYRVGATYERTENTGISKRGRDELENRLRSLVRIPFEVIGQDWGLRPTVPDRRPLIGRHPAHPNVYVFNGMGTKAVSMAPYFSRVLGESFMHGRQIAQEVNISRFYALSSKSRD